MGIGLSIAARSSKPTPDDYGRLCAGHSELSFSLLFLAIELRCRQVDVSYGTFETCRLRRAMSEFDVSIAFIQRQRPSIRLKNKFEFNWQVHVGRYLPCVTHSATDEVIPKQECSMSNGNEGHSPYDSRKFINCGSDGTSHRLVIARIASGGRPAEQRDRGKRPSKRPLTTSLIRSKQLTASIEASGEIILRGSERRAYLSAHRRQRNIRARSYFPDRRSRLSRGFP